MDIDNRVYALEKKMERHIKLVADVNNGYGSIISRIEKLEQENASLRADLTALVERYEIHIHGSCSDGWSTPPAVKPTTPPQPIAAEEGEGIHRVKSYTDLRKGDRVRWQTEPGTTDMTDGTVVYPEGIDQSGTTTVNSGTQQYEVATDNLYLVLSAEDMKWMSIAHMTVNARAKEVEKVKAIVAKAIELGLAVKPLSDDDEGLVQVVEKALASYLHRIHTHREVSIRVLRDLAAAQQEVKR